MSAEVRGRTWPGRRQHRLFAVEVGIQHALGEPDLAGDRPDRRARVTPPSKQQHRGAQERLLGVAGVALVAVPARVARLLRFGDQSKALRAVGAADLALVPGLLTGRHQREWLAVSGGLDLAIAVYCVRVARHERARAATSAW